MTIHRFEGDYNFLSNFYRCSMSWRGHVAPTLEHHFQAAKAVTDSERLAVLNAPSPGGAKRLGKKVQRKTNWDDIKRDIMLELLHIKFQNPVLRMQLLQTGTQELIEGNTWNDTYWGVCNGVGENWLGKLLMQVRQEIRDTTR